MLTLVDENSMDTVYTIRPATLPFQAKVFDVTTSYTVIIGDQTTHQTSLTGIRAATLETPDTLRVTF